MEINATLLVLMVLFLLLFAWLPPMLFDPLLALFAERERRIEGAKHQAKVLAHTAEAKLQEVEEKIKVAQKEGRQLLTSLKAEGEAYQRNLLDQARTEAKEKSEVAKTKLKTEIQKVKEQLQKEVAPMADSIVERLAGVSKSTKHSGASLPRMEF